MFVLSSPLLFVTKMGLNKFLCRLTNQNGNTRPSYTSNTFFIEISKKDLLIDLSYPGQGVLIPVLLLLVICAYPYLNFVIELFENFLDKKLFLHDYGIHDYLDEFEIRPNPTAGMHDYSDKFEIQPRPTMGMHDNSDEFEIRPDPTMGMLTTPASLRFNKILPRPCKTTRTCSARSDHGHV